MLPSTRVAESEQSRSAPQTNSPLSTASSAFIPATSPASTTSESTDSLYSPSSNLLHPLLDSQSESFNQTFPPHSSPDIENLELSPTMPSGNSGYGAPGAPRQPISLTEINQMLQSLRTRRVNTLTEIRRIERTLVTLPAFATDYCSTVTDAWNYYVNSNNFLNELRALTREYPFSAELLSEAKVRVINDPNSSRSWNFAWLLLCKMRNDQMIPQQANRTSQSSAMWGGYVPDPASAAELASVLNSEWTRAVDQLLRHWPVPPTFDGSY